MAPLKPAKPNLGCVFTQHKTDEKGHPVRDHDSTTYVSTFQSIDEFGPLLRPRGYSPWLTFSPASRAPAGWSRGVGQYGAALFHHGYPDRGLLSHTRARREGAGGSF